MIVLIDNYDSFTYNLVDYFGQLGVKVKIFRSDASLHTINLVPFRGIVLSPGPEKPSLAGNLKQIVARYIGKIPMLGICLGHQAIAEHFGAELTKAEYPMHGKISEVHYNGGKAFAGVPNPFNAVRYHSLIVRHLPQNLNPIAKTSNGELMAFESEAHFMAWGLQFHPEAIHTQYGLEILKNWTKFYNIASI